MASDAASLTHVTGRCYCGACSIWGPAKALTSLYCHCVDCRRWTGAPAPAFAAFLVSDIRITPDVPTVAHGSGAERRNCPECGSPLWATFPYLPDQAYVPVGVLDIAADLPPASQSHADAALPWVCVGEDIAASKGSGRDLLNSLSDD